MFSGITVGLIHGGFGGGTTWKYLEEELRLRGLEVVTPDLPVENPGSSLMDCAEAVADSLNGSPGPIALVAHSGGGLVLPLVPSLLNIDRLIGLAAILPKPGVSWVDDVMPALEKSDSSLPRLRYPATGQEMTSIDPEDARKRFFHDCTGEVLAYALQQLRPQSGAIFQEASPLHVWPAVPSSYIVCGEDRSLAPSWQRMMARERAGAEPVELVGVGHSPFYSKPAMLADVLEGLIDGSLID